MDVQSQAIKDYLGLMCRSIKKIKMNHNSLRLDATLVVAPPVAVMILTVYQNSFKIISRSNTPVHKEKSQ